jgi:hypothetical protein
VAVRHVDGGERLARVEHRGHHPVRVGEREGAVDEHRLFLSGHQRRIDEEALR